MAAAAAPGFHDRFDDTFDIPDFCGSGVTVQVRDLVVGNGHESDTGFTVSFTEKMTFTYGDRSITSHSSGRLVEELEGDPEGAHGVCGRGWPPEHSSKWPVAASSSPT